MLSTEPSYWRFIGFLLQLKSSPVAPEERNVYSKIESRNRVFAKNSVSVVRFLISAIFLQLLRAQLPQRGFVRCYEINGGTFDAAISVPHLEAEQRQQFRRCLLQDLF